MCRRSVNLLAGNASTRRPIHATANQISAFATYGRESAPNKSRANVARNAGIVSLAVMASRLLGLVRDQVFAALFGAGLQYDAFLTAFRVPNLLRDLLAEGALSSAFVTTFTQTLQSKGREEALRLSNRVATLSIIVITIISILAWFFTR